MKKKIFSIIGIFTLLFSLTGCIKFNATMEIREDKSMDFSIIYAMNKQILEMSEEQQELLEEKDKEELVKKGFTVEDYEDTDNKGFKLTKKISNIDDYSSDSDVEYSISGIFEEASNEKIFKVVKGDAKNKYIANFKFDSNDNTLNDDEESTTDAVVDGDEGSSGASIEGDTGDLSQMGEAMSSTLDLKFIVKLPDKPISDNATSKSEDGRELTWKLNTNQTDNIKFEFELNNSGAKTNNGITSTNNIFSKIDTSMIIGVVALIIGVVALVIALITMNNKNKKKLDQ